jgi:tight adherence protein B
MRTPQRVDPLVLLAVVAAWLLAGTRPAHAGDVSGSLTEPTLRGQTVQTTLAVRGLSRDERLDPSSLSATVGGTAATVTVLGGAASSSTGSPQRGVVIVMDTSGSMAGAGIAASRAAAGAFLAAAPTDVRVGLVTFADRARLVRPLSADRRAVARDVQRVTARGETSLYDALTLALRAVGSTGDRRLLVLSDGADTRSRTTLAGVLGRLHASGTTVDVVGFRTSLLQNGVLGRLAAATGGEVRAARDAAGLSRAFGTTAHQLASQLRLQIAVPASAHDQQVLTVSVGTSAGPVTVQHVLSLPAATATSVDSGYVGPARHTGLSLGLVVALGALFLGLYGLSLVALGRTPLAGAQRRGFAQLLAGYTLRPAPARTAAAAPQERTVVRTAVELGDRVVKARGIEERLRGQLERAGYVLRPGEWVVLQVALGTGSFAFLLVLGGGGLAALAAALVVGWLGPRTWLRRAARRRQNAFLRELPDALQLLSGSLASGYSLPQALDALVNEGRPPISAEVGRALAESRLGVDIEEALDNVAMRLQIPEFQWVVMAVRVQREVGGNLAGVLTTVASTLRDRERLRRHVRALSAEGRLSGVILVSLPVAVGAFFYFFENAYVRVMYTTGSGVLMSLTSITLVVLGWLWMRKMATVEV